MTNLTIDGLRVVSQNLKISGGVMAKIQADYVDNAIKEIERLNAKVAELRSLALQETR